MGEGRSCKCDLTINITFSKTAISCFPRRLEQSVSLEESLHGHVSSCAFKKLEVESRGGSNRRESNLHVCAAAEYMLSTLFHLECVFTT